MDNNDESISYENALEMGLLETYKEALNNGLLHHYELGWRNGDIEPSKNDVWEMFRYSTSEYKKKVQKFKDHPEYLVYEQYKFKQEKEKEIYDLNIEIKSLKLELLECGTNG